MFSSLAKHRRGRAKIKLTLKRGMDLPLFVGFWDCIQSGEEPKKVNSRKQTKLSCTFLRRRK